MRFRGLCLFAVLTLLALPALGRTGSPPISFSEAGVSELADVPRRVLPPLDLARIVADAEAQDEINSRLGGGPYIFAEPQPVAFGVTDAGAWEVLADGARLWRMRVATPGARHVNLGFSRFELPEGSAMWLYNRSADYIEGPFTARDASRSGEFWSPIVYGDEIVVEVYVPAGAEGKLDVRLGSVNHGFRAFNKAGACNIDVVCPEGDDWRDQINSVGFYTINGFGLCSGQMMANTSGSDRPLFLSADHCNIDAEDAERLVFYWKYQSPVCGQQSGGSLQYNQSGSTLVANEAFSDFLLLELNEAPLPEFDVFYTGWDRSGNVPNGSVAIHHPSTDEKSISFNEQPLGTVGIDPVTNFIIDDGISHWVVDNWELGTTEGGSSGSGIWDPDTGLMVGWLTGGFASCFIIEEDFYGKMSFGWSDAGDSESNQLAPHLDPTGTGVMQQEGYYPEIIGCRPTSTNHCFQNRRFEVSMTYGDDVAATVVPSFSDESGNFSFFQSTNWEMLVKVLDGCRINGYYWVFAAGATSLPWELTVTDKFTEETQTYQAAPGIFPVVTNSMAFACATE